MEVFRSIFEGTQGFLRAPCPRLNPLQSRGRSLGTPTMTSKTTSVWSELLCVCHSPRDLGLCRHLRLRTDPHHQGSPTDMTGSSDMPQVYLEAHTSVRVGLHPPSQPPLVPLNESLQQGARGEGLGLPLQVD